MRVAVVTPYDLERPGGVQDQTVRLVRWLQEAGHGATLIGPGVKGPDGAVLLGPTVVIPVNRSAAPVKLNPLLVGKVRDALEGFDVVHVHEPFVPMVSAAALLTKTAPVVATFHADPPAWIRRGFRLARAPLRRALERAEVVTVVSPVAGSAVDGLAAYRIIPNGIDVAGYTSGPKNPFRATYLGRDDTRKGLSILLRAWPQIRTAVPQSTLHVIGAERSERIDGVTFLGRVSEEDKRRELAASAVHVAPNLGGESFGIALLEAMASGCAVVASSIPAFDFVVGDTATLVPPGDAGRVAQAVGALLDDPDAATAAGRRASERASSFDLSIVATQYVEAYEDALERPSG